MDDHEQSHRGVTSPGRNATRRSDGRRAPDPHPLVWLRWYRAAVGDPEALWRASEGLP